MEHTQEASLVQLCTTPTGIFVLQRVCIKDQAIRNRREQGMRQREIIKESCMSSHDNSGGIDPLFRKADKTIALTAIGTTLIDGARARFSRWEALDAG